MDKTNHLENTVFRCLGGEARQQRARVVMRYIVRKVKYESGIIRTRVEILRVRLIKFIAICMFLGCFLSALGFRRQSKFLFYMFLVLAVVLLVTLWWLSGVYYRYTDPLKFEINSSDDYETGSELKKMESEAKISMKRA